MYTEETFKPAVFEGRQIRKAFHEGEWWFSIIDVVEVLVGGDRPRKYWNDLKKKLTTEGYFEVSEKIGQLKMAAPDGKQPVIRSAQTAYVLSDTARYRSFVTPATVSKAFIDVVAQK